MNDQSIALDGMDDERRSSSPKRKKIRQKYAPKACVSCRRSKLKCSGENPCQRCIDNGKRCFYSEDETAAQVLQTLSRPTPAQPQHAPSLSNGNGLPRRNILPRHGSIERRASDASMLGATMETRMARMETMMEALLHDRGMTVTPMGSIERGETGSDGMQSEVAFALPLLDPINPALAHMDLQPSMPFNNQDWMHPHSATASSHDAPFIIRLMDRELPFPCQDQYLKYMLSFFDDIHLRYPCLDESSFRSRGQKIFISEVRITDIPFLALNYTIMACCDALLATRSAGDKPHGWHWFEISKDLIDRNASVNIQNPLERIQLLLFDALYLSFSDIPGPAYDAVGLASRLVFKQGLHQQRLYSHLSSEEVYNISCTFWNVFVVDRWISLSCGRPCSFHDEDIDVDLPMDVFLSLHKPPEPISDLKQYINLYMKLTTLVARRAGLIWSGKYDHESLATVDCEIHRFQTDVLPNMNIPQIHRLDYNRIAMGLSIEKTTLLLLHRSMTTLQYNAAFAHEFSSAALNTIHRVYSYYRSTNFVIYHSFRHQMTSSVAAALLALCSLLVRDIGALDPDLQLKYHDYVKDFQIALILLDKLSQNIAFAKRVLADFEPLLVVVRAVVQAWHASGPRFQGGFEIVKRFIPPNVAELFPYRALMPSLENGLDDVSSNGVRIGSGSVLWLF